MTDAYCERIGKRHKTVSGRIFRPCKQSTIDMRRREIVAAVRAAVAAGIPLEDLKSLRDLLRPDRVEILLDYYWEKNGEKPSLYTIDLASKLLALARSEDLTTGEIEGLDEIRIALEQYRSTGLTEKNRGLIRQIAQSDVWREVVRLPQRLMAEARITAKAKPYRTAVTAQLAHRRPDPHSGPGPHTEPRLNSHRHQSGEARGPGRTLYAHLSRL
jgi:hypothetical protein